MASKISTPSVSPMAAARRQKIESVLEGLKLLPSSVAVPMHVLELKRNGTASASEFSRAIAADGALAAEVLALANSASFSPVAPVTQLTTAISRIGLNNLLPFVFGLSFAGIFNKLGLPPAEQAALWRASLLKAVAARTCARRLGGANADALAEQVHLAALLQDVALPVFHAADRSAWAEYLAVLESADADRVARERQIFGTDHCEVGARCLRRLGLPASFADLVASHHNATVNPDAGALPAAGMIAFQAVATLPHRITAPGPKTLQPLSIRLQRSATFPAPDLAAALLAIWQEFASLIGELNEPADSGASFKEFLQQLGEEVAGSLRSAIGSNTLEINSLKERERQLEADLTALAERAQQAETDPLTKALTRLAFLTRLAKLLSLAHAHGVACAVGFLDMDNFKHVNDDHGHAAGDAALVQLARTATTALGPRGIVGRVGGDEFVFAFVARPDALDADIATFNAKVSHFSLEHEAYQLQLSTSIGVLPMHAPAASADPADVLKQADALMYTAKRAGKGRAAVGPSTGLAALEPGCKTAA